MPLSNILANSSNQLLLKALKSNSERYFLQNKLLSDRNYFLNDATTKISNTLNQTRKGQLKQYISVSAILHFIDSWKFFANAIDMLLKNDSATTLHLAYYSELRSVMSIMATQGVGNFNSKHVWYDTSQHIEKSGSPDNLGKTHEFAKNWINDWTSNSISANVVFKNISYKNFNLNEWLSHATTAPITVLSNWLHHWSMDFDLYVDQGIRNEFSYRPHFKLSNLDLTDITEKVITLWNIIEPIFDEENISNFKYLELDKFLVRRALEYVFEDTRGLPPNGDPFKIYIEQILANIGLSHDNIAKEFLLRKINVSDPFFFNDASIKYSSKSEYITNPLPLISRAFLLLRLNNCLLDSFLSDAKVSKTSFEFFLKEISFLNGLINDKTSFNLTDLYSEVTDSFSAFDFTNTYNWSSLKKCSQEYKFEFSLLHQFERASILGIAI